MPCTVNLNGLIPRKGYFGSTTAPHIKYVNKCHHYRHSRGHCRCGCFLILRNRHFCSKETGNTTSSIAFAPTHIFQKRFPASHFQRAYFNVTADRDVQKIIRHSCEAQFRWKKGFKPAGNFIQGASSLCEL